MAKGTRLIYDVKTKETRTEEYEYTPENPRLFEIPERQQEILTALKESDYKAIKFAEGHYTEEAYASVKAERQALRDEYNQLEAELAKL
jgi:predicted transcriptional regulator